MFPFIDEVLLQLVNQPHQFIDFGDDAVLFGSRREWHRRTKEVGIIDGGIRDPFHLGRDEIDKKWSAEIEEQETAMHPRVRM